MSLKHLRGCEVTSLTLATSQMKGESRPAPCTTVDELRVTAGVREDHSLVFKRVARAWRQMEGGPPPPGRGWTLQKQDAFCRDPLPSEYGTYKTVKASLCKTVKASLCKTVTASFGP